MKPTYTPPLSRKDTQKPHTIQWKSPTSKNPKKPSCQQISTEKGLQTPAPHEAAQKETHTHTARKPKNIPSSKNAHPQAASPTNFGWCPPPRDEGLNKPWTQADNPPCRETPNTRQTFTSPPPHPHQHNDPQNTPQTRLPHQTAQDPHIPARGGHH